VIQSLGVRHRNDAAEATSLVHSALWQAVGVVVAFGLIGWLHRSTDGLWYQGDAPRHAMNGLFWWDLLRAGPGDPLEFAVRYFARYPVINPASYPPLFYVIEGTAFAALGASPYVAKNLVLLFACAGGLYTMAWARRWIAPAAGWAGAFLAFVPGVILWSNAVMLNIPAMSLSIGALYHFRRCSEIARRREVVLTGLLLAMVLLTYYPAALVLGICAAWLPLQTRLFRWNRRLAWIAAGVITACLPIVISLWLAPVHTARHLPSARFLTSSTAWTFYWRALPDIAGWPALGLGAAGLAACAAAKRWRKEGVYLATWIGVPLIGLSMVPAQDRRYILLLAPAFVLAAAIGIAAAVRYLPLRRPRSQVFVLAIGLSLMLWPATRVQVPEVTGFRDIATFLKQEAPVDTVLYDGRHAALFGFYVRAQDSAFERRLVRGDKFLYERAPTTTFKRVEKTHVASPEDVVRMVRDRSGCRWVAFEDGPDVSVGRRILRQALARPEFELVRSFPISGADVHRVDLYRLTIPVEPVTTVDLEFPAYLNRKFIGVVPLARDRN
jgi:hypothetical protein